jgi:hypothetical protein
MTGQLSAQNCPICAEVLRAMPTTRGRQGADLAFYDCPRCGGFGLTRTALINTKIWLAENPRNVVVFSHALRRMQIGQEWPLVDSKVAERIIESGALPKPDDQADILIRWLGDHLPGPGELIKVTWVEHGTIMGALTLNGFMFVVTGLSDAGLINAHPTMGGNASVTLTFAGWQRYHDLKLGTPTGRKAFMAMQYDTPILDRIVNDYLRPAVEQTGFRLVRLNDNPKAGLIEDRLRVEIQEARFLIADLTHRNPGAYWEAGYAEGLGKPVIYMCEKVAFDAHVSHFDTSHRLHVLWTEDDPKDAGERLKASIRATIPEAKREDS